MATSETRATGTEMPGEVLAPLATQGPRLAAAGSVLAAVAASSCCLVPFGLAILGVSGAWLGALPRLAPYQPIQGSPDGAGTPAAEAFKIGRRVFGGLLTGGA